MAVQIREIVHSMSKFRMKIPTFAEYSLDMEITQGGSYTNATTIRSYTKSHVTMWYSRMAIALTSLFFKCGLLSHNVVDAFSWDQLTRARSFLRFRNLTCSSCWVLPLLVISVIITFLRPSIDQTCHRELVKGLWVDELVKSMYSVPKI